MMFGLLLATAVSAATPRIIAAFVRDRRLTRYSFALSDLNGDGRPEALVYAADDNLCGSGGCELYVLSHARKSYRVVTAASITRPPIRVLPTVTHGWHDLGVWIGGGGVIPGYEVRLRFNGRTYPENPTVPPAIRLRGNPGKVVIASFPPMPRHGG